LLFAQPGFVHGQFLGMDTAGQATGDTEAKEKSLHEGVLTHAGAAATRMRSGSTMQFSGTDQLPHPLFLGRQPLIVEVVIRRGPSQLQNGHESGFSVCGTRLIQSFACALHKKPYSLWLSRALGASTSMVWASRRMPGMRSAKGLCFRTGSSFLSSTWAALMPGNQWSAWPRR